MLNTFIFNKYFITYSSILSTHSKQKPPAKAVGGCVAVSLFDLRLRTEMNRLLCNVFAYKQYVEHINAAVAGDVGVIYIRVFEQFIVESVVDRILLACGVGVAIDMEVGEFIVFYLSIIVIFVVSKCRITNFCDAIGDSYAFKRSAVKKCIPFYCQLCLELQGFLHYRCSL